MTKVFISSPYTKGDVAVNVRNSLEMADLLMDKGFAVFAPLLAHFQHMMFPRPYDEWLRHDLAWLKECDCVIKLPGESKGSDIECAFSDQSGIPVYHSIDELLKAHPNG